MKDFEISKKDSKNNTVKTVLFRLSLGIFAIWVASVFGYLNFFEPNKEDDFKNETAKKILLGIIFALSSVFMNAPMFGLFVSKSINAGKKFWYENDWIFRIAVLIGAPLGLLTALAGLIMAIFSLEKWAWRWFAIITAVIFAVYTFATRAYSLTSLLDTSMNKGLSFIKLMKRCCVEQNQNEKWLGQLIKDLKICENSAKFRHLTFSSGNLLKLEDEKKDKFERGILAFYDAVIEENISLKKSSTSRLLSGAGRILGGILALGACYSLWLWLALIERGLNKSHKGLGDITVLVWLGAIPSLALYVFMALKSVEVIPRLWYLPEFDNLSKSKKLLLISIFATIVFSIATASGNGYIETVRDERKIGLGSAAQGLLDFYPYQLLYDGVNKTLGDYFWLIYSGAIANGVSAVNCILDYMLKHLKKIFPSLFKSNHSNNDVESGQQETISIEELKKITVAILQGKKPEGFENINESQIDEIANLIEKKRAEYVSATSQKSPNVLLGDEDDYYCFGLWKRNPEESKLLKKTSTGISGAGSVNSRGVIDDKVNLNPPSSWRPPCALL